MKTILHLKSDTTDALAGQIIDAQRDLPELQLEVVELNRADYRVVLEKIFAADAVAVW